MYSGAPSAGVCANSGSAATIARVLGFGFCSRRARRIRLIKISAARGRSTTLRNTGRNGIFCWARWRGCRSRFSCTASPLGWRALPCWWHRDREVDVRNVRGIALVDAIDELDRRTAQPALGIDVVTPDLQRGPDLLADRRDTAGQCHPEANLHRRVRLRREGQQCPGDWEGGLRHGDNLGSGNLSRAVCFLRGGMRMFGAIRQAYSLVFDATVNVALLREPFQRHRKDVNRPLPSMRVSSCARCCKDCVARIAMTSTC